MEETFNQLLQKKRHRIGLVDFIIEMELSETDELYLVSTVFSGGNYIPRSVRAALTEGGLRASDEHGQATLWIDEAQFRVLLVYERKLTAVTRSHFEEALSHFLELAQEWKWMLDQYGQRDLVHAAVS